jgi:Cys-tRNA(Pro)/Cys-tRNA(Cys) deacylase
MKKTNAARILDKMKIKYEIIEYEVDESDLSAEHVAQALGKPLDTIFKTLVLKGDKTGVIIAIIPGGDELDLKAIALISGNKSCAMVPLKDVVELTGYIRGGCSPIGMKKSYPTFIDESALLFEKISISAGVRGQQFYISPAVLIKITNATRGKIALKIQNK